MEKTNKKLYVLKIFGKIRAGCCAIKEIKSCLNKSQLQIRFPSMIQSHINYANKTYSTLYVSLFQQNVTKFLQIFSRSSLNKMYCEEGLKLFSLL